MEPLASKYRPKSIEDVVGQKHIIGKGKLLSTLIKCETLPNMIFYGPSGTGKTTVSYIIAEHTKKKFFKINATTASISDVKDIINKAQKENYSIILYIDEIQYFNKKQQQSILSFMENGTVTLIASTTENPYFSLFSALLSRSTIFEFKNIEKEDVEANLYRVINLYEKDNNVKIDITPETISTIAFASNGDVRKSLNALELLISSAELNNNVLKINNDDVSLVSQKSSFRYDRDGDEHYDILSAFQKSIRGSDPDAAIHYLARLIVADDLQSICRRLMVIASEDIGLAYPQAVTVVKSCVDSAFMLGLPEARIPLSEATIYLCILPKSNSAMMAIDAAINDIKFGNYGDIPSDIMDAHYAGAKNLNRGNGYKYPHNYKNGWVQQQYLPEPIKDKKYYHSGNNKFELSMQKYWDEIKGRKN